ncbi:hypothetical protein [uncultured Deinococcus sp.]|uniref:hypothetical protein n=1 Tax=uncultured Deinococcus sp. TaxID=158789 RepID=UPI0025E264FB|nr:hypothetical protein [uncultured Deinococcus sp.]
MAEGPTKTALDTAITLLGGTTGLAALGVLIRGIFTGSSGQDKEMREGLAERVGVLEARVTSLEARLEAVTRNRDAWRWAALSARLKAEELAGKCGVPAPTWIDPKED